MFHKTTVIGHVGRDAEMRFTPSGKAVTSFSVAANDGFGENKKTIWYRVTAWEKLAETCNQYVKKGMLVYVEGRLQADTQTGGPRLWQGNSGDWSASFELTANEIRFLSRTDNGMMREAQALGGEGADPYSEQELPF